MLARYWVPLLVMTVIALAAFIGCGKQQPSTGTAPGKAPSASTSAPVSAGRLGTEQSAGPFAVTLTSTPTPPRVGKAHFMAMVMKNGQHVRDATVRVIPSMPSMAGSEVNMEPMGNEYGATVDLSMPGDWTAEVDIALGGDSGTAEYRFTVSK